MSTAATPYTFGYLADSSPGLSDLAVFKSASQIVEVIPVAILPRKIDLLSLAGMEGTEKFAACSEAMRYHEICTR